MLGADGKPVAIYYRENQRRENPETDGGFCLSPDEAGVFIRARSPDSGVPRRVAQQVLDRATVLVKPWWLYRDYRQPAPVERYGFGSDRHRSIAHSQSIIAGKRSLVTPNSP